MRGLSKADKAAGYDALKRERDAYADIAWHVISGHKPDAVEHFKEDGGGRYEFRLYGATTPDGGVVAIVFTHPTNKAPQVEARGFCDWRRTVAEMPFNVGVNTLIKIAAERLQAAAARAYREDAQEAFGK